MREKGAFFGLYHEESAVDDALPHSDLLEESVVTLCPDRPCVLPSWHVACDAKVVLPPPIIVGGVLPVHGHVPRDLSEHVSASLVGVGGCSMEVCASHVTRVLLRTHPLSYRRDYTICDVVCAPGVCVDVYVGLSHLIGERDSGLLGDTVAFECPVGISLNTERHNDVAHADLTWILLPGGVQLFAAREFPRSKGLNSFHLLLD